MAIGGYFELELDDREEYHGEAIRLNSGSNAFKYILQAKGFSKVYLPSYTCEALISPVEKLGIQKEFYSIDKNLEPVGELPQTGNKTAFLYINYFGLKDAYIKALSKRIKPLIIDNAQSFFSRPLDAVDTLYSPRKFFGVPDGGYLYTDAQAKISLQQDISHDRMQHLVERIDGGPRVGYRTYLQNENDLFRRPMRSMSKLTQRILGSIDYEFAKERRVDNYLVLDEKLGALNKVRFPLGKKMVPMVYPFVAGKAGLREFLIRSKIYVAQYWPNVIKSLDADSLEYRLARDIIPLPVDQRYTSGDMEKIVHKVKEFLSLS